MNKFLKGIYMGIHQFEHFINKLQGSSLKHSFMSIQKDFKHHAILISERIQNLGGTPVSNEGIIGKAAADISGIFEHLHTEQEIIKHAIKGENLYGIKMSEDLVRDQLDKDSLQLVHKILEKDREHVDYLKSLLDPWKTLNWFK